MFSMFGQREKSAANFFGLFSKVQMSRRVLAGSRNIETKSSPDVTIRGASSHLEAAPGFGPGMMDLQSTALPLGYAATKESITSI